MRGIGTEAWPVWILWTAGCGWLETPNALFGVSEETCWPRLGAGCLRPVTLPSQVIACSCSSSPGRAEPSSPADGSRGPRLLARRRERGGGERRQRGDVDDDAVGVQQRARHLQALEAVGREPLGDDRDHAAAGLDAGAERVHQQPRLLVGRRLRDGVDAALGADDPLGLEPEGDDHRCGTRLGRRRLGEWTQNPSNALPPERAHGHNRDQGRNTEQPRRQFCWHYVERRNGSRTPSRSRHRHRVDRGATPASAAASPALAVAAVGQARRRAAAAAAASAPAAVATWTPPGGVRRGRQLGRRSRLGGRRRAGARDARGVGALARDRVAARRRRRIAPARRPVARAAERRALARRRVRRGAEWLDDDDGLGWEGEASAPTATATGTATGTSSRGSG